MNLSGVTFCHVTRNGPVHCHVLSCQPDVSCPMSCFVMSAGMNLSGVVFCHNAATHQSHSNQRPEPIQLCFNCSLWLEWCQSPVCWPKHKKPCHNVSLFYYKWSDLWSEFPFPRRTLTPGMTTDMPWSLWALNEGHFLFTALDALIVSPVAYTYRELTVVKQHSRNNI